MEFTIEISRGSHKTLPFWRMVKMRFGTDEFGTKEIGTDEIGTDEIGTDGLVYLRLVKPSFAS